ncbi:unnamed protein product [Miscanthus lutarioriparius]|uniref:Uncharacterized protein n=1 Tax=Miscanthus lutarioriparius TaxID=422564 RepID=A0A811R1B6_9POAL|nr:unnamed protein product [Miscanthus lutarioriparius]
MNKGKGYDLPRKKVHNEGLHQIGDEDFLREMGIGCDDTGLELTQLSEIIANKHCEQSALARDLEVNIQSYYNFDSNIVNPNYTNEQSSIPPVNYNSYGQEQEMQRQEVIMSPGGTSYVLSQGGSSYTSLMNQVIAQAKSSNQNYEEFLSSEMTGSFMDILNEPFPLENRMFITTSRIYELPQDDAGGLRNKESEAVLEFANEENMVHEERQDEQGSEGEQDTEGNTTKQHLVASEEQDEAELRAIQIESQSIMAAERLSQEHASRHVPQLGMKFKTTEDAYSFYNDYAFIVGFSLVK